jgi:8-oxo-dGTP pyrophosphatase MutT (NUDIX family)
MKHLKTFNEMIGSGDYASFHNRSGDDFWGNIGGGVVPICSTTGRILLPYRSRMVNEPHTWGVWGGKIDEERGEAQSDIEDVVQREFTEESGFRGHIELIPAFIFETPSKSFKYYNFIGILDHEYQPRLDWETEKFKWVTFDEMMNISPKHFGLQGVLNDRKSMDIIKRYSK